MLWLIARNFPNKNSFNLSSVFADCAKNLSQNTLTIQYFDNTQSHHDVPKNNRNEKNSKNTCFYKKTINLTLILCDCAKNTKIEQQLMISCKKISSENRPFLNCTINVNWLCKCCEKATLNLCEIGDWNWLKNRRRQTIVIYSE